MKIILIIDDNAAILDALQITLESENYCVRTLSRAEGLMDKVARYQPDLILLDFLLSGIDGQSVAHTLKTHHTTKHIPILMLSAHADIGEKAKEAGIEGFLAKPFDIDTLLTRVKRHILQ